MRVAFCALVTIAACRSSSPPASPPPGSGATATSSAPARDPSWPSVLSITDDNGCFTRNGLVHCWGANDMGQLGDGTQRPRDEAAPAAAITDAIDVATLTGEVCALHRTGAVVCWGVDEAPRPVLDDVARIEGHDRYVCGVRNDGTVAC